MRCRVKSGNGRDPRAKEFFWLKDNVRLEEGEDHDKSLCPKGLGYTCVTMVITKRCKNVNFSYSIKINRSSDYSLQLENMKLELLVIVYQHDTVN